MILEGFPWDPDSPAYRSTTLYCIGGSSCFLAPTAHGWATFILSLAAGSVVSVGCVIFHAISREVREEFLAK